MHFGPGVPILTYTSPIYSLNTMPAVATGKVLVTGVNGYIGLWVARVLLERGYTVRGTVRSEGKAQHIRQLFKPFAERFEMVVVPDITKVIPTATSLFLYFELWL